MLSDIVHEHRHSLAGGTAGFVSRVVASPFDVVKIRLQLQVESSSQGLSPKYNGVASCARTILREEGASAFWKGHAAAQVMTVGYCAVQFACHHRVNQRLQKHIDHQGTCRFLSGGLSGLMATASTYPLDLIRTRFATQGAETKVYTSLFQATTSIVKDNGVPGLFRASIFPYAGLQFMLYGAFKDFFAAEQDGALKETRRIASGLTSGVLSKFVVFPLDTVKKRLQVQGFEQVRQWFGRTELYHGPAHCFRTVVAQEGIKGLYKGVTASMLKAAPTTAVTFCVYEWVCASLSRESDHAESI